LKKRFRHVLLVAVAVAPACSAPDHASEAEGDLEDPETATPTRDPVADDEDAPLALPSAFQTLAGAPALTVEQGVNVTGYIGD